MRIGFAGLVVVTVATALTRPVSAQEFHAWTLCTVGDFRSCHSVQIQTTAVMSGGSRTGTDVTVTIHNLSGQIAADNTTWSGLLGVYFGGPASYAESEGGTDVTPTLIGGATGNAAPWVWNGTSFLNSGNYYDIFGVSSKHYSSLIGGCGVGPLWAGVTMFTCGPDAAVTVSFSTYSEFDAPALDYAAIYTRGGANGLYYGGGMLCSNASSDPLACDVLSETSGVVPEPVSMVLLGTGLLGIGGLRLRRRSRSET